MSTAVSTPSPPRIPRISISKPRPLAPAASLRSRPSSPTQRSLKSSRSSSLRPTTQSPPRNVERGSPRHTSYSTQTIPITPPAPPSKSPLHLSPPTSSQTSALSTRSYARAKTDSPATTRQKLLNRKQTIGGLNLSVTPTSSASSAHKFNADLDNFVLQAGLLMYSLKENDGWIVPQFLFNARHYCAGFVNHLDHMTILDERRQTYSEARHAFRKSWRKLIGSLDFVLDVAHKNPQHYLYGRHLLERAFEGLEYFLDVVREHFIPTAPYLILPWDCEDNVQIPKLCPSKLSETDEAPGKGPDKQLPTESMLAFLGVCYDPSSGEVGVPLPLPDGAPGDIWWKVEESEANPDRLTRTPSPGVEAWDAVAASTQAFVRLLTTQGAISQHILLDTFFLSFRVFSTPSDFLLALTAQFTNRCPPALSCEQIRSWRMQRFLVQLHSIKILQMWLQMYWNEEDERILDQVTSFIMIEVHPRWPQLADKLHSHVRNRLRDSNPRSRLDRRLAELRMEPPLEFPRSVEDNKKKAVWTQAKVPSHGHSILTFKDKVYCLGLAQQLALMSSEMFHAIIPEDMLTHFTRHRNCQDKKRDPRNHRCDLVYCAREGDCHNKCEVMVKASTIATHNRAIGAWVMKSILDQPSAQQRGEARSMFIRLASCCRKIRNFHCLVAIVNALAYSDLSLIPDNEMPISPGDATILNELVQIISLSQKPLRKLSAEQGRPLAPFMPIYLKWLESTLNGKSQDFKSELTGNRIVNISSFMSATKCIREMERWHLSYAWTVSQATRSWITEQLAPFMLDEPTLEAQTLKLRPICKQLKEAAEAKTKTPVDAAPC